MEHAQRDPLLPLNDTADITRLLPEGPVHATGPRLPDRYRRPRLVLMVRDPHWLFAYWEWPAAWEKTAGAEASADDGPGRMLWLCVHETDAGGGALVPAESRHRVGGAGRYYLRVAGMGRRYVVRLEDERGSTLLTSNVVTTPRGCPAGEHEGAWLTREVLARWLKGSGDATSPGIVTEELSAHVQWSWLASGTGSSPAPATRGGDGRP